MTDIPAFPRYGKNGNDRAQKVHSEEIILDVRAPYHIYYRKNGKSYFVMGFGRDPEAAVKWVRPALGRNAEILGVLKTEPVEGLKPWAPE